jgi:hypothetical protein
MVKRLNVPPTSRVFENRMLRRIFGAEWNKVPGEASVTRSFVIYTRHQIAFTVHGTN